MRILMVTNTYAPARNGVAQCVRVLRREMTAAGHEVEVLTARLFGRSAEEGVHEVRSVRGFAEDFPLPVALGVPHSLKGERFDIVHVHHPELLGPLGLRIARDCGARTVFTAHSVYTDYLDHYLAGLARPWKHAAVRRFGRLLSRFDLVIAPCSYLARVLAAEWGVSSRVVMLEAAADMGAGKPPTRARARATLGVAPDARLALVVARLAPEKRVDVVVREFAMMLPLVPDAELAIVGDGGGRASLLRLADGLGVRDRVRVMAEVPRERLDEWYAAADVHVSASLSETGPLTVVEAMASGTPTVAYDGPGFEDRIATGDNGILVERREGDLAAAMAAVLGDVRVRAALSEGALAHAPEHAPARVAAELLGYYDELLLTR